MGEILRRILALVSGALLFLWFVVVLVASANPNADEKRIWLTVAFGVMVVAGLAGVVIMIVWGPIPGLGNRLRRGLIYVGTIGVLLTVLALAAMWNFVLLPFWGVVVLVVVGLTVLFTLVVILSYYALR